jgi:hypothetical protein
MSNDMNLNENEILNLSNDSLSNLLEVLRLASIDLGRLSSEERNSLQAFENQLLAERSRRSWNR